MTYELELPKSCKIHLVFHAMLLTAYKETEAHGPNFTKPPPDLIQGEEEYEVEAILNHKRQGNGWKFLVKWKGYPSSENMWLTTTQLKNSREVLNNYKKRHKLR